MMLAHGLMAHDVFAHHDRIVDQQAHANGQRKQGHQINGEPHDVHHQEGADE